MHSWAPSEALAMLALAAALGAASATDSDAADDQGAREPVVHGRVILPDGGSPGGLRATLRGAAAMDSIDVDARGTFTLRVDGPICDSLEVVIDSTPGAPRRYHAAYARVASRDLLSSDDGSATIRVVLVPTRFTIEAGTYQGTTVGIDVDAALAGRRDRSRFWRASRSGTAGDGTPIGWPEDRFPLPLSIVLPRGGVAPARINALWETARRLERDIGRPLFREAPYDSSADDGWRIVIAIDPTSSAAGTTFITYDERGMIYDADIELRSPSLLGDTRVVSHELLHTIGFGHAVAWGSVMSTPYQASTRLTPTDVAYAQLLYRLRRSHLAEGATHGFLASTAESRRSIRLSGLVRACR